MSQFLQVTRTLPWILRVGGCSHEASSAPIIPNAHLTPWAFTSKNSILAKFVTEGEMICAIEYAQLANHIVVTLPFHRRCLHRNVKSQVALDINRTV